MNFKIAIVRQLPKNMDKALRIKDVGDVEFALAEKQHEAYCKGLEWLGFEVKRLPALEYFPDSMFVEDPCVIFTKILVKARLKRKERQGEEKFLYDELSSYFKSENIFEIKGRGFLEGGDVIKMEDRVCIGISDRTNIDGAMQLSQILEDKCGCKSIFIPLPKHLLHLKGCATFHQLDKSHKGFIITTEELYSWFEKFDPRYEIIKVSKEEGMGACYGANALSKGNRVLIHAKKPLTKAIFKERGFNVRELEMSEFEKKDGAITCLSKIF